MSETQKKEDKLLHIFYSTIQSVKTITDTIVTVAGRSIHKSDTISFVNGRYVTDNEEHIKFLMDEIAQGHPHIYIKKGQEQQLASELDPIAMLKKKHYKEFLEEQAVANVAKDPDPKADVVHPDSEAGIASALERIKTASVGALKPASTKVVGTTAPESNG